MQLNKFNPLVITKIQHSGSERMFGIRFGKHEDKETKIARSYLRFDLWKVSYRLTRT